MQMVHLPQYTTPLVGREKEIADIGSRLREPDCRLLTLVGPGGIGKTRLAIEAADQGLIFQDGIFFVALQPVAAADTIVQTVGSAIGYDFSADSEPALQLQQHLKERDRLLILDNLEHLQGAAGVITKLLAATLRLKLLATSREPLNLQDEWLYHVEGLPFPDHEPTQKIESYDAVRLFTEHASRVRRDFSLDDEQTAVANICRLVQGMPLGIELAAKWRRRLPSTEIARQLESSIDILQTDLRDVPDRHRSMRAVFDHSWGLFSDEERRAFMALSVFRGGFRLEAAEQVAGTSLAVLMSLVDKSMLRVNRIGRYDIHELQRQYAAERLAEQPEFETDVRDRHAAYYTRFIDRPVNDFLSTRGQQTLKAIDSEIDNFRAAWSWAVTHQKIAYISQAIQGLYWYTWRRSWHEEGQTAFRDALSVLRAAEPTRSNQIKLSRAMTYQAAMDIWLGHATRAGERARESAAIARPLDAPGELAHALHMQGWAAATLRKWSEARHLIEEAVVLYNEVDRRDQKEIKAFAFNQLGYLAHNDGDFEASKVWHQQALQLGREINDQRTIAETLRNLGHLARRQGHYSRAGHFYEESLAIARAAGIAPFVILDLQSLGFLARITGRLEEAHVFFTESLRIAQDDGKGPAIAATLISLAGVLIARGEYETAEAHMVEALAIPPGMADRLRYAEVRIHLGRIAWQKGAYADARRHFAASKLFFEEVQDSWALVKILVLLARIALVGGDDELAVGYLIESQQTAIQEGAPPILLHVFSGISELFLRQNTLAEAVRLADLVLHHPASEAESKDLARSVMNAPQVQTLAGQLGSDRDKNPDLKKLGSQLQRQLSSSSAQPLLEELSARELEVLQLVAAGKSNRDIARELILAVGTVKTHLHNIMQKLDASSRTQAVARARELRLL